jgi:penicillin-binding protein 2
MSPRDFSLEDAVMDDLDGGYDVIERPLSERLFTLFGIAAVLVGGFFIVRTGLYGTVKADQFADRAYANAGAQIILRAPRGIIYDRYGTALVSNEPSFNVSLNLSELFKRKDDMHTILGAVRTHVDFNAEEAEASLRRVNLERESYLLLARNVPLHSIIELKKADIPSVVVEDGYIRSYPDGEVFSHILGYTGLVSRSDLDQDPQLDLNDEIGKSGVERVYDSYLRGENGSRIILRDAQNNVLGERIDRAVQSGARVHTTIDAELQRVFYNALKNQLASLGRNAGAGLALDPQTGEVLALVSLPSFDPNNLTSSLFTDPAKPTFNRVVSGVYSPGSTIKPLVAFGALEEQVIDPLKSIYSAGFIELPNPYNPDQPSRFVDWKPHGWVNVYSALARSSNVYFYEVGGGFQDQRGLGIDRLRQYWQKFLLDQKTGIDLPGEAEGYLPAPDTKEKRTGQIWRIGDTYNVSIGQGDLMVTPLELLRYIGAVATKGKLFAPHVVLRIEKEKGNIAHERTLAFKEVEQKLPGTFNEVEAGMLQGSQKDYGTSYMLHDIPLDIAAKTGSAQIQNNQKTNAFFVGYNLPVEEMPARNNVPRQIAVLVLIEDAREGSLNAVPVGHKVFQWYYEHRIKQE